MSSNVQVLSSENMSAGVCGNKHLVQNYQNKVASQDIYVLNVNSQLNANTATEVDGSAFIRSLRQVRPFEAYMVQEQGVSSQSSEMMLQAFHQYLYPSTEGMMPSII